MEKGGRTPTGDEIRELISNTSTAWTKYNDVFGYIFTSNINNVSIFLPVTGHYQQWNGSIVNGERGYYYSSENLGNGPFSSIYFTETIVPYVANNIVTGEMRCQVRPVLPK